MSWNLCTTTVNHSKIKLDDHRSRRHVVFLNPNKIEHKKTVADGCWKVQKTCADWVISCFQSDAQVIVELKGKDTDHAVKQITETAKHLTDENLRAKRLAALIVCTQYPANDTKIQRARIAFKKLYNAPIHVITKSEELEITKVVLFGGPK